LDGIELHTIHKHTNLNGQIAISWQCMHR
jgi:hypothetical protein